MPQLSKENILSVCSVRFNKKMMQGFFFKIDRNMPHEKLQKKTVQFLPVAVVVVQFQRPYATTKNLSHCFYITIVDQNSNRFCQLCRWSMTLQQRSHGPFS